MTVPTTELQEDAVSGTGMSNTPSQTEHPIHKAWGLHEKMLHSYISSLGPALREGRGDQLEQPPCSKEDQEHHEPCELEVGSISAYVLL